MNYIDYIELKKHLNIESSYIDDDSYLQSLCSVASLAVSNYCNSGLSTYTGTTTGSTSGITLVNIPVTVMQATLLLAAHFYLNRQPIAFASANEIPLAFKFLLDPYRNIVVM